MDKNPYQSPVATEDARRSWAGPVFGTFLLVLAVVAWAPMTIGSLAAAAIHPEKDFWIKIGAGAFHGLVMAVLIYLGRRLRGSKAKSLQTEPVDVVGEKSLD
jgi:hypothetical protein